MRTIQTALHCNVVTRINNQSIYICINSLGIPLIKVSIVDVGKKNGCYFKKKKSSLLWLEPRPLGYELFRVF